MVFSMALLLLIRASAAHFLGGTVRWQPTAGPLYTIRFDFSTGWELGTPASPGCTAASLGQIRQAQHTTNWTCERGCYNSNQFVALQEYVCTTVDTDFEHGHGFQQLQLPYPAIRWPVEISYVDKPFSAINFVHGDSFKEGLETLGWRLSTLVDVRERSDIGRPNSSPAALWIPRQVLQLGCSHELHLQAMDPDGDAVRCRWAVGKCEECGDVCGRLPGTFLRQDTCQLTVNATYANNYRNGGQYVVSLTVEDYPSSLIMLDSNREDRISRSTSDRLSAVPLVFIFKTVEFPDSCREKPYFIDSTPNSGSRLVVSDHSNLLKFSIHAKTNSSGAERKITNFMVLGPSGITKDPITYSDSVASTTVTLQVKDVDDIDKNICFSAQDDTGKSSELRCLSVAFRDTNECDSDPCKNGGTCIDQRGSYRCECRPGFRGKTCSTTINECLSNPCQNGATCKDATAGYLCNCRQGFAGFHCESKIHPCDQNPCVGGGLCLRISDTNFRCRCKRERTGPRCENMVDPCLPSTCATTGTCLSLQNASFYCLCKAGYTGKHCNQPVSLCRTAAPCAVGSTCRDEVNSFTCFCPLHKTGKFCENSIDLCKQHNCTLPEVCVPTNDFTGFQCVNKNCQDKRKLPLHSTHLTSHSEHTTTSLKVSKVLEKLKRFPKASSVYRTSPATLVSRQFTPAEFSNNPIESKEKLDCSTASFPGWGYTLLGILGGLLLGAAAGAAAVVIKKSKGSFDRLSNNDFKNSKPPTKSGPERSVGTARKAIFARRNSIFPPETATPVTSPSTGRRMSVTHGVEPEGNLESSPRDQLAPDLSKQRRRSSVWSLSNIQLAGLTNQK